MKHKILKLLLSVTLAGALAFSGVGSGWTGMETVEAAKIVAPNTLGPVTGIQYDAKTERISWNKVARATYYYVKMTDSQGYSYTQYSYGLYIKKWWFENEEWKNQAGQVKQVKTLNGAYTINIIAQDRTSYYPVESGGDTRIYDTVNMKYVSYKYPAGTGSAVIRIEGTAAVQKVTDAISALPGIAFKEVRENSVILKTIGISGLKGNEKIYWEYSNNAEFIDNSKKGYRSNYNVTYAARDTCSISLSEFAPGDTMYVRAQVYNPDYRLPNQSETPSKSKYGAYTKTITYNVPKAKIDSVQNTADANSVTLTVNLRTGSATGYQFAKKVKSKWVTLGTQTSNTYVDKGLNKNKKYQYRARCYYYNKFTKKTTWSDWYTTEAVTWGASLNLKANAVTSSSVKLTWRPVPGAEGYEIYRYEMEGTSRTMEKGLAVDYNSKGTLIKTIKGKKAKAYTDKKLGKGRNYTYIVRAYATIEKKKCYIEESAVVESKAENWKPLSQYYNAAGQLVVSWQKMPGIKGYYVERYDKASGEYVPFQTLKAKATSYTFPKVDVGSNSIRYRICPFDEASIYNVSDVKEVIVKPSLAAVQNVKAARIKNGVQISWQPVAGADYYKVYRTTRSNLNYDKTAKLYQRNGGETLVYEVTLNTAGCQPELGGSSYNTAGTYSTSEIRGTSVCDATVTYRKRTTDEKGNRIIIGKTPSGKSVYQTEEAVYHEGPEPGATYYYYVVAVAEAANGSYDYDQFYSVGCSKPAAATYTNAVAKKVSKITSASSKKKGQVTIKYKKVSKVDGYAIYRSNKKNGTYTMVGTSTKTSFTDAGTQSGKTYYYKVASYVKGEKMANIYSAKTAAKRVKVR